MTMVEAYQETDDAVVRTYRRVHGNGEQTHVTIVSASERDYVAVAYDIDPAEFEPVAATVIGYDPTIEGVTERAERWMDANPKGVLQALGADEEDSGGGTLATIKRVAGRLNDYGNDLHENAQQAQHGQQMQYANDEDNN